MRRIINSIILLAIMAIALPSYGQGLKAFKLKNGLSVYIWEDNTKSDVYGIVACRTGSVNDPAEYTGLAHYLEHVMFKGTDKIGALDWATEKPLYDKIIAKYDEMADEADPVKKEAIAKEINELTVEAAKVSVSTEFMNLIESMGGKGLNAGTSFDVTYYHNSFPPYQINKWLEIYSQRMINPVFRLSRPNWKVYTKNTICIRMIQEAYSRNLFPAKHTKDTLMHVLSRITGTPEKPTFE